MIQLLLDATVHEKIRALLEPAELVTAEGQVIAKVFPKVDASRFAHIECPLSADELAHRRTEKTGRTYTTAEVLKYLESL